MSGSLKMNVTYVINCTQKKCLFLHRDTNVRGFKAELWKIYLLGCFRHHPIKYA